MWHRLISAIVLRPVTTAMVTVTVVLFGLVAALRLPVDLLPDTSFPSVTIQTDLGDAAPAEVEELVTRPIEELVGAVPGVVRVESVSREGKSEVVLDFAWGTSIDSALADVREKLDRVRLPTSASRPLVLRYDPAQEPILRLALTSPKEPPPPTRDGPSSELARLRQQAERDVERTLEKVPGVAAVQLHGGEEDEVRVEILPERLLALGVTSQEIVDALTRDNVNRPGGGLTDQGARYLIRTLQEARTPQELEQIVVRTTGGANLTIQDLAVVGRRPIEPEELAFVDGQPAVELAVFREGDANTVSVARGVTSTLAQIQRSLPEGQRVIVLSNRAQFIESAISEVISNTLVGGLLAVLVLLFFLQDLRATLIVAVAIPISVLATFVPLNVASVSLNLMSLGGLALGVGMLVDNSIVVLESIARRQELNPALTPRQAAALGTAEVADSVVASTLTTVAVFFPMVFVDGVVGQLIGDLGLAVSFSIVSSMLVSLSLVPVLAALRRTQPVELPSNRAPLAWLLAPFALLYRGLLGVLWLVGRILSVLTQPLRSAYDALSAAYSPFLRAILRLRHVIVAVAVAVCAVSFAQLGSSGRALMPEVNEGEFFVQITLPQGAALEHTAAITKRLAASIEEQEGVSAVFARVGSVTQGGSATGATTGAHLAQIDIHLSGPAATYAQREQAIYEVLREAAGDELDLRLGHPSLLSFSDPLELRVLGDDPVATANLAAQLVDELASIEGILELRPDDLQGRPELRVDFDRERLARLGLSVDAAALAVQRAIQGELAGVLHAADDQLDVRVQLPRVDRSRIEDVGEITVAASADPVTGRAVPVRLAAIATLEQITGPAQLRRLNGRRGVRIQARVGERDLGSLADELALRLDAIEHDPRLEPTVGGQADELERSVQSLILVAALSVFLVYVVMASTFESLHHPFLIMISVPFAIVGVVGALSALDMPVSALVGMGVIVLGGIVVNNAIVLVNAVNARRGRGQDIIEAVVAGSATRVRPILMTTATTVLGLLPMALGVGDGAALRQPLAVTVIAGLLASTLLTLAVLPCLYAIAPGAKREAWAESSEGDDVELELRASTPSSTAASVAMASTLNTNTEPDTEPDTESASSRGVPAAEAEAPERTDETSA